MTKTEVAPTVPIAEFGLTTMFNADVEAWARTAGVRIVEDYLGRPAVSLADAYRLRGQAKAAEQQAQKQAELRGEVHSADLERMRVYKQAFAAAMQRTTYRVPDGFDETTDPVARPADPFKARAEALAAVAEFDKTLPREVLERCNALPLWPSRQM